MPIETLTTAFDKMNDLMMGLIHFVFFGAIILGVIVVFCKLSAKLYYHYSEDHSCKDLQRQRCYYLIHPVTGRVLQPNDLGDTDTLFTELMAIDRLHGLILNNPNTPAYKREQVDTLLNDKLVSMITDYEKLYRDKMAHALSPQGDTYRGIFLKNLTDIRTFLQDIVVNQTVATSLTQFNIHDFGGQDTLIEPLQGIKIHGERLIMRLDPNSEQAFVIRKIIDEYLPQVAIDYQHARQNTINPERTADEVLTSINNDLIGFFDKIECGEQMTIENAHYHNLLVFERYLKERVA